MLQTLRLLGALALVCVNHYLYSQTTENFDSRTTNATSFTSGGLTFNLSSANAPFAIVNRPFLGYDGSDKFIELTDNPQNTTYGATGVIAATGGTFRVNNFWLYVTGNANQTPGGINNGWPAGEVTFTGKRAGNTLFSFTKTSGFDINFANDYPANGFVNINFATDGPGNYTNIGIDRLEIKLNSSFDYFAIDNFNWSLNALPVTFGPVSASVTENQLNVSWQTLSETNNDHFTVEASGDGVTFHEVGNLSSKSTGGNSATALEYEYTIDLGQTAFTGSLLLGLLFLLPPGRRYRNAMLVIIFLMAGIMACQKKTDAIGNGQQLYVRVAQTDKDQVKTYSKVVKATLRK